MRRHRGSSPTRPSAANAWRAKSKKPRRNSRCRTSVKSPFGAHRTCRAASSNSNTRPDRESDLTVSRTDAVTRILFEAFSKAEVRLFYLLGYAAIAVFFYGVYVQVRKYRRGAALKLEGGLWSRFIAMLSSVLSHRTVDRRDRAAGGAHRLIFYGFMLLFAGTATITLEYDILEPLFGIRFWQGEFYLIFSLILDIAGVALIAGLLFMMYRRGWLKPPKLDYARPDRSAGDPDFERPQYRREDWAFLWTLVVIGATGYLLEAARLVWLEGRPDVWDTRWWSPVGAVIAEGLQTVGLDAHGGGVLRLSLWWFH